MSKALVVLRRQVGGDFQPVGVFLGTRKALQSRFAPGAGAEALARRIHEGARQPVMNDRGERGTWEDWVDYGLDALSNGHDLMAVGVEPALTVDELYSREVLGEPKPSSSRALRGVPNVTTIHIPDGLEGPAARA